MISSCIISGLYMKLHKPLSKKIAPWTVYNFTGPLFVSLVGTINQVVGKLAMDKARCIFDTCSPTSDGYYFLLVFLVGGAFFQLFCVQFIMAKLNIVTVIPLYGCFLTVLPVVSGLIFFREEPNNYFGFICSITFVIILNFVLVYISQERFERKEAEIALDTTITLGVDPDAELTQTKKLSSGSENHEEATQSLLSDEDIISPKV